MKFTNIITILLFLFLLPMAAAAQHSHHGHANSNELQAKEVNKEHSLHHMQAEWTTHRNEKITLRDFAGKPVIVVMYYGNCTQVCPILIRDVNRLFESVDQKIRNDIRVLAVTFDPDNDTPEKLNEYAAEKNLDLPEWHFVTGKKTDIRELAMLIGVEYSKKSNGHFAHSNLVTLIDGDGKIVLRMEGLNQPVDEASKWLNNYLTNSKNQLTTHKH